MKPDKLQLHTDAGFAPEQRKHGQYGGYSLGDYGSVGHALDTHSERYDKYQIKHGVYHCGAYEVIKGPL